MRQQTRQLILSKGFVFIVVLVCCTVLSASRVSAQQSELKQQILQPDCTAPKSCEMKTPTINSINKNGGRPVITGTYDAAFTKNLRVIFGGRIYTLGLDSELTVQDGGAWRLDLSVLSPPLSVGNYELIVETVGYDGEVRRMQTIVMLTSADISKIPSSPGDTDGDNGAIPDEPSQRPQPSQYGEGGFRISFMTFFVTTLVIAFSGYALLAATRRHRGPNEKNVL